MRFTGIATVAYEDQPISPYAAVNLGCSLGFVSPTFQARQGRAARAPVGAAGSLSAPRAARRPCPPS